MDDELYKPLGLQNPVARRRSGLALAALSLAALAVAGVGFSWYRGYFDPAVPEPQIADAGTAATAQAPAAQPKPVPITPTIRPSVLPETPDAPPLAEVEPQGRLEPVPPPAPIRRQESGLAHLPDPALVERGATGVIPRRGPDGARPMDVYSRPPDTEGNFGVARVVIIVGGLGISQTSTQQAVKQLPGAVTLAFAPYGNSLARWMQAARQSGHELLLQLPLEPFDYPRNDPGPHTLKTGVSPVENLADLHWAMSRLTNYVGVINFLGGKFLTDESAMKPVFDQLAERGLLFVDDGSLRNTASGDVAKASLLPYARVDVLIDAVRTRQEIARQLSQLSEQAKRTGLAIGMANAFPETIEMIASYAAQASRLGIEITPVSAIVRDPERKSR